MVERSLVEPLKNDYDITEINSRYSIIHISVDNFYMCVLGTYPYHIFPSLYILDSYIGLEKSGVSAVQYNANLALFGQGVIIGFIDTGIEYQHEAFLHIDGTTRLQSIWDQTIETGNPPEGFTLGSEYSRDIINLALQNENPLSVVPSTDENGHGTMMAGIAAGSSNDLDDFSGVAPEAELVMVKLAPAKPYNKKIFEVPEEILCYPESNILLGIEYIRSVAERLKRPYVICLGMGSSQGDHDGHSAIATTLNTMSSFPRTAICVSAGNEGNNRRHHRGQIAEGQRFQEFEMRVDNKDRSFSVEIWQSSPSRLAISVVSPSGERVPDISPGFNECRMHNFVMESSKIIINNIIIEEETGEQLILIRFEDVLNGIWRFRMINIDNIACQFDAWLPAGNLISPDTYFLVPDPYITITSPGNARNPITATAYNQLNNSILMASSRGFSAGTTVLPDIAAPGYALTCPIISKTNTSTYGNTTGTGAAAAHTAGIAAMLLEWAVIKGNYTTITGRDISRLMIRGARRESNIVYPNPVWGYGQIDILGVFRSLT